MVAIIDYGMGNVASVQKALNYLSINNVITADPDAISGADFILLPGVGSFMQGMKNLQERKLDILLTEEVMNKKKRFLGICLGMQLIAEKGTEPVICKGLGWVKGSIEKMESDSLRIPHMGWNNIEVKNDSYFKAINKSDYYFIHSYHFVPQHNGVVAATVEYGNSIVAAIQQENIFATQFHPEKSQSAGLSLLKNYFENA